MEELARTAPRGQRFRVHLVGGGTAVMAGWRSATLDADLYGDRQDVFRHVQGIKERLRLNVEFVRLEHFVPPFAGSADRHRFIEPIDTVDFYHYDPYAQPAVQDRTRIPEGYRGRSRFREQRLGRCRPLPRAGEAIPEAAWSEYPTLSRTALLSVVDAFLADLDPAQP